MKGYKLKIFQNGWKKLRPKWFFITRNAALNIAFKAYSHGREDAEISNKCFCPQGSLCEFFKKEDESCLYGKI